MRKLEKRILSEKSPIYHNTWLLLQKYRDISWSMELSVQEVRRKFSIEYGSSVEEFLDSIYLAGAELSGTEIEHHAQCIKRSHQMLALLDSAVELLRAKHKNGEAYYWILYHSYLSPHRLHNVDEIIDQLRPHIQDISYRTYYRKRRESIEALGAILWGYSARDCLDLLEHFFPERNIP